MEFYKIGYAVFEYNKVKSTAYEYSLFDINQKFLELTEIDIIDIKENKITWLLHAMNLDIEKSSYFITKKSVDDYFEKVDLNEKTLYIRIHFHFEENKFMIYVDTEEKIFNKEKDYRDIFCKTLNNNIFLIRCNKEGFSFHEKHLESSFIIEDNITKLRECIDNNREVFTEIDSLEFNKNKRYLIKLIPSGIEDEEKYVIGIKTDITDLIETLEIREKNLKKFDAMFKNHTAVMLLLDPEDGRIVDANPSASVFYGYSNLELKKMKIHDINVLKKEELDEYIKRANVKGQKYFLFPHKLKNGEVRMVDVYVSPIEYGDTNLLYSIIFDVTEREKNKKEILYLSNHDTLTGLYNRRIFNERWSSLNQEKNYPLGIIMGDVNGLKLTNDVFGHEYGDFLLTNVSKAIKDNLDDIDTPIRWGGDEFIIILCNADEKKIKEYLDLVRKDLIKNRVNEVIPISISFGYVIKKNIYHKPEIYIQMAEEIMYQNKTEESRSFRRLIINSILDILDYNNIETIEHSKRVSELCTEFGIFLNLRSEDIRELEILAKYHDIGKIAIRKEVLLKKGYLSTEEFEEVQRHSEAGYRIALNIPEYSFIALLILCHHERWDGYGYPRGLKEEEIPFKSRLLLIIDAFDSMSNDQVYRKAMSIEDIIKEIDNGIGTQFDPELSKKFLEFIKIKYKI